MTDPHRQQIGRAFSAARDYDAHARVQRLVAERLADRIAALPLTARPRILEIGCGTGFLTEALIRRGLGGEWLITDLSAEMLERCRQRVGEAPDRHFAVLDGEHGQPEGAGGFDLICSSMAVQWFDDLYGAVARMVGWLAPGGHVLFTTLGTGTFAEWRAAHDAAGVSPGTPDFPAPTQLIPSADLATCAGITEERHPEHYASGRDFVAALKAIGAATARRQHRPLRPEVLRRVLQNFEAAGSVSTYHVITCHFRRPPGAAWINERS